MARIWSVLIVSCMLALLFSVDAIKISEKYAERSLANFSNCNVTGPIKQSPQKLWIKESNQIFVCKPCRMKYQAYFNCTKCSITEDPVCDDESLRKLKKNYLRNHSQRFRPNKYLPLISQLILFKSNEPHSQMEDMFHSNLIHSIYTISHSPFFIFLIDNCGSASKHFNMSEINLFLRAMKNVKKEFSKLFNLEKNAVKIMHKPYNVDHFTLKKKTDEMDQILHGLCNSEIVNKKHKMIKRSLYALNGIISKLSPLRQRREVEGSQEDDHLIGQANIGSETQEKWTTTSLHKKHRSTIEDTVTPKTVTEHIKRTGKKPAGKKHLHRVRGKKHRDFNKNLKHNNGSINFNANIKSSDLNEGSPLNKIVFDKQITRVDWRFNVTSRDDTYGESDKVNATYVKPKSNVSYSENSRDLSASSYFSSHMDYMGSSEAPWGMSSSYSQQFSEQVSKNSSVNGKTQLNFRKGIILQGNNESYIDRDAVEHDLSSQLEYRKTTELESSFKLSPTTENSRMRSSLFSNVFQDFTRPNDTSSDFLVDTDRSRNDAFKYTKDIKIAERLVKMNSSTTSKEDVIANEMGVPNHTDRKFLVTSFDQSGSNYVTAQHLFKNASSNHSIKLGESVKKNSAETVNNFENMPLGNISEEQGLKNLLPLVQDKNHDDGNTNYRSREDHSKTIPSSLRKNDFTHTTENKEPNNTGNAELISINVKTRAVSIKNVSSELQNQPELVVHSPTSTEDENGDTKIGNSRNLTDSSSRISFQKIETEEYSTDSGAYEHKLDENQTLVTSQIKENFPIAPSNFPHQQRPNSTSNTLIESGNFTNSGNFRDKQLNFTLNNKNDTNQTLLETPEHPLDINKVKETNTTGTLYNALGNVESRLVNNTSDELNGGNRISEGNETSHGDNSYRVVKENENKGLPFSYERVMESDKINHTAGFKSNHMSDLSSTMLSNVSGEQNRTSSKESISDDVDKLNVNMFKDFEIETILSGHSIDHTNTHGLHDYRTTKDESNGSKSSTTVIHDSTTLDRNEATVKAADKGDNGRIESYNPESITSIIRYKRDQPVTEIGSKSIQINKYIPEKSIGVLRSLHNSSDLEKNQEMLNNGTIKEVEKANKEHLKSKNLRKKYKSQCVGLCKNVNDISTVPPNLIKDHTEYPNSMKVNHTSDGHSKRTVKKQLQAYSSDYDKKQNFPHTLKKLTESMKHYLPANESGENPDVKGVFVKQNFENPYPSQRQQYLLKGNPKDILFNMANGKKIDDGNELVDSKFRTGRKLLHFSGTDGKKLTVKRFWTPISLRRQRSVNDLPEGNWCNLPDDLNFKRIDCTVWTYQKKCLMSCNNDQNVKGAQETIYTCTRKKNVWEPKVQSCLPGEVEVKNSDLKEYQPVIEKKTDSVGSKIAVKPQPTTLSNDNNVSDYYEYDDEEYEDV